MEVLARPRLPMDLTPIKMFMCRLRNGHVYSVTSCAIEDSVARLQAAVTCVDVNALRRVQEKVWRTVVCLKIDGGRFKNLVSQDDHNTS